ncbi:MAG TPA: hypothetical protein VGK58_19330 [Lacipirellulaceae bacterium]
MPRFGTRALLIGLAVAGLWLHTLSGYPDGREIRRTIGLVILLASGFSVIYCSGRQRAFWIGFFAVMLCQILELYSPPMRWLFELWGLPEHTSNYRVVARRETIDVLFSLSFAVLVGYIGVHIYDSNPKSHSP